MKNFKEVYQLPFKFKGFHNWVYDQESNFCFQFENYEEHKVNHSLLKIINNEMNFENLNLSFSSEDGEIKDSEGNHWITIRGWGNLTSENGLNLSEANAANVQDTLAEYIVERLNKR